MANLTLWLVEHTYSHYHELLTCVDISLLSTLLLAGRISEQRSLEPSV